MTLLKVDMGRCRPLIWLIMFFLILLFDISFFNIEK